ncbi:MAG: 16S rRNA (adenine(1518)-N(6)/adenine(1519)-N(6))-dimethyltransferase RsmA [Gammaproteobacteria bacterium]|nr:16S rRNA (adenine(1518)-N(6)/adenine(1519)-N(6))-dimethyltransferase RsmA [Gammaproteobacteria bacterium]
MKNYSHTPRKRFGQNFLIDPHIIQRIVQTIAPEKNQHLVEIGPGQAALTKLLIEKSDTLDVIEIDRDLVQMLQNTFSNHEMITIHSADALTFDFAKLVTDHKKLRLIGNLPYNISTPLIFHLLRFSSIIDDMHFMLQKEVVDRLAATPGSDDWGRLSVMVQYHCDVRALFQVPPSAFNPPPRVQSAIVKLTPHATLPVVAKVYTDFENVVRTAFTKRRKMIRNALKDFVTDDAQWKQLNINPELRPEELSVADYVKISNNFFSS